MKKLGKSASTLSVKHYEGGEEDEGLVELSKAGVLSHKKDLAHLQ